MIANAVGLGIKDDKNPDPTQKINAADNPKHMEELIQKTTEELSPSEVNQLKTFLLEFSDVFVKDDVGNFTAIEHSIDTGNAKSIKHKMCRTPANCAKEEEHMKKMLKVKVIQPSVLECSPAPVLISKRDSAVRWCIDYRTNKLMLGREVNQPVDLIFRPPTSENDTIPETYVCKVEEAIRLAHNMARKTLRTSQNCMKRDYYLRTHEKT